MGVLPWLPGRRHRNSSMENTTYDALIVGSGVTGGWAAKELTEKGLNVLVLEAGRMIIPEQDYVEHVPVWEMKFRDWDNRTERLRTQNIQRAAEDCDEFSGKFFVTIFKIPTPGRKGNRSPGFADVSWEENPSPGDARPTAGATWISKPMPKRASRSTGRFVTRT